MPNFNRQLFLMTAMNWQSNIINRRLEAFLHICIWGAFMSVYVIIFSRFMPWEISLLRAFGNVLPMAFLFYINLWLVDQFIEQRRYVLFALIALALFLGATFLRSELNTYFPDVRREMLDMNKRETWFFGALLTNLSFAIIGVFYQMLSNRYRSEQRNMSIISEQREAQLQALRAQINPHFLFNTLNNIYSLAVIRSEKTAEMVLRLSNLLRYVIYDGRAERVALKREVEHIRQFIELFQMRSEEELDIQFNSRGEIDGVQIEPMILIPIVENCFKHCDFDTNERAFICIDLKVRNGQLFFKTVNSKDDRNQQKDRVGGVGLENIRKRLELRYQNKHELSINNEAFRFEVVLHLTF